MDNSQKLKYFKKWYLIFIYLLCSRISHIKSKNRWIKLMYGLWMHLLISKCFLLGAVAGDCHWIVVCNTSFDSGIVYHTGGLIGVLFLSRAFQIKNIFIIKNYGLHIGDYFYFLIFHFFFQGIEEGKWDLPNPGPPLPSCPEPPKSLACITAIAWQMVSLFLPFPSIFHIILKPAINSSNI